MANLLSRLFHGTKPRALPGGANKKLRAQYKTLAGRLKAKKLAEQLTKFPKLTPKQKKAQREAYAHIEENNRVAAARRKLSLESARKREAERIHREGLFKSLEETRQREATESERRLRERETD